MSHELLHSYFSNLGIRSDSYHLLQSSYPFLCLALVLEYLRFGTEYEIMTLLVVKLQGHVIVLVHQFHILLIKCGIEDIESELSSRVFRVLNDLVICYFRIIEREIDICI